MTEKIKIRWKEGLGLFVFLILSGLYFFGTPDFYGVLDYKYTYYYEELITFFSRVILPAPFLVGIFLLSLYKTEKRIKEGRFSFWRPLVFSLVTALITGLVWTLQFIMGSGYGYESFDVVKRLFFDVGVFPVIPMTLVFIFSLAPSLIFYRFKESVKKFHTATIVLFLFIFAGLFGYQQAGDLTCGFNYDSYCVGSKALKAKDISLCEKVKTTKEFSNYDNYGKNSCYEAISRRWDDISLCDKIRTVSDQKHYSQYQLHQCVSSIARNTKNKELCEKIPISKFKEICFRDFEKKFETGLNNWKTYKNEEHGFEFKYPNDYETVDQLNDGGQLNIKPVGENEVPTLSVEFIYNEDKNFLENNSLRRLLNVDKYRKVIDEQVKVGGFYGRKIGNSGDIDMEDQDYREIIVDVKGKILFIMSGGIKDSLLNQILSTFKFTD